MPFDDDIARKMGDLLLKGYCLLNSYCSVCSGPLMRSRDGVGICVACRSLSEVKENNQTSSSNGMDEDSPTASSAASNNSNNLGESSSLIPSKRTQTGQQSKSTTETYEKFVLPSDVWRYESIPKMLCETIRAKLSLSSSRLLVDAHGALSLIESCINLLSIIDANLSDAPEYMMTMLNLEKFVAIEQQRLSESSDIIECKKICDTIYLTLKIMRDLDRFNVNKLNPL